MLDDLETIHLRVDHLDRLWLRPSHGKPTLLGHIDEDPEWPEPFGPEPRWFTEELGDLLDAWNDANAGDWRREVLATYERGIGACA